MNAEIVTVLVLVAFFIGKAVSDVKLKNVKSELKKSESELKKSENIRTILLNAIDQEVGKRNDLMNQHKMLSKAYQQEKELNKMMRGNFSNISNVLSKNKISHN